MDIEKNVSQYEQYHESPRHKVYHWVLLILVVILAFLVIQDKIQDLSYVQTEAAKGGVPGSPGGGSGGGGKPSNFTGPDLTSSSMVKIFDSPAALDPAYADPRFRGVEDFAVVGNILYPIIGPQSWGSTTQPGPAKIFSFDTVTKLPKTEYTTNDRTLRKFTFIDDVLYVPGSYKMSGKPSYYDFVDGVWQKHQTIPKGDNVEDIIKFDGKIFAIQTSNNFTTITGTVMVSVDDGTTWKDSNVGSIYAGLNWSNFFVVKDEAGIDQLYVDIYTPNSQKMYRYAKDPANPTVFVPTNFKTHVVEDKSYAYNGKTYTVAVGSHEFVYVSEINSINGSSDVKTANIPFDNDDYAFDVFVGNDADGISSVFALVEEVTRKGVVTSKVFSSRNLINWYPRFSYTNSKNYVHDIGVVKGDFYLGYSFVTSENYASANDNTNSGKIVYIPASAVPPAPTP